MLLLLSTRHWMRYDSNDNYYSTIVPIDQMLSDISLYQLQDYGNFSGSNEDIHSVTLPRNHRHSVLSSGASDSGQTSTNESGSRHSMVGKDDTVYEQKRLSRTLPHTEYIPASPKRSLQAVPTSSNANQERLQVTEHHPRPVSSLSSGYGSAVSNAVAELKEKALYKAEVVKQFKWISSTHSELVLEVRW